MNILDLYPSVTPPGTTYLTEMTDLVTNLTYTDAEKIAEAYYMGYINYDDIPDIMKTSYCRFVDDIDNSFFECEDITVQENVPWFFTSRYYTSPYNRYHQYYYPYDDTTQKYVPLTYAMGAGEFGFLNRGAIASLGSEGNVFLHFTTCAINQNVTPNTYSTSNASNAENDYTLTFPQFLDFMSNNYTISMTFNKNGETITLALKRSDLDEGFYDYDTPAGNKLRIFLTNFSLPTDSRDIESDGTLRYWSCVCAGIKTHYNDPNYGIRPCISNVDWWHYNYDNDNYLNVNFNGKSVSNRRAYSPLDINIIRGGYKCRIPRTFFQNAEYGRSEIYGNCVADKEGSTVTYIYRLFTPTEIYHDFVMLFTRICTGSYVYGFDANTYVPLFNEDNSPKWEFVHGNLADIQDKLRLWQYNDITDNDFLPDDIPEYNPSPAPSGWGDDRYGSVPGLWLGSDGITANFITPWVLRGSQVTNFGQFLWENLFLPDPDDPSVIDGLWRNFKDALGTYWQTGSFDPASTLDFVISLLFFPFKLDTFSSDSGAKTIFFGTGVLGLTVSSSYNTRKLSAYHGYLHGGSLDLTDSTVRSALNIPDDFRGLANTSACLYLPFCGTYQVNWADVRDSVLGITYAIDFTTGACTAYVASTKNGQSTYILTTTGMVGFSVPLTATNANRLISSILGDVAQSGSKYMDMGTDIGTKIISGGQADKPSQVGGDSEDDLGNALTMSTVGGPVGSLVGGFTMAGKAAKELFSKPSIGIPMMAGGSGWDALHCPRTPYLQVRTPQYVPDAGHGHALGWPAEKQATTISSLPAPDACNYYECVNVDTSTLTCTHEERQMIKQQLEMGFYIRAE